LLPHNWIPDGKGVPFRRDRILRVRDLKPPMQSPRERMICVMQTAGLAMEGFQAALTSARKRAIVVRKLSAF
jgi:hypothetical protein